MEEGIIFLLYLTIVEIIFWGVAYGTGYALIYVCSFGSLRGEPVVKDEVSGKKKGTMKSFFINQNGVKYVSAYAVCFIGVLFWVVTIIVLVNLW